LNQLNFRLKQENQTAAVMRASMDSQPRTRQEARSSSETIHSPTFSYDTVDPGLMSRLHFEDILRSTEGTKLKLFIEKQAAVDVGKWWGSIFIDAIAAQLPPFQISLPPIFPPRHFDFPCSKKLLVADALLV
jgi:hypothetical protein